jgi:hypothetical protein
VGLKAVKVVEVRTRVSEAKGPCPGGKRVGSRGKKKKETHPSQWVGLRAMIRGLGVGGKKKKAKVKEKVIEKVIEKERSPSSEVDELEGIKIRALQRLLILKLFTLSQCSRGLNRSAGKSSHLKLLACTGLYL